MLKIKKLQISLSLVYMADTLQAGSDDPLSGKAAQIFVPFHVFNTGNQEYVIVSGDDRVMAD